MNKDHTIEKLFSTMYKRLRAILIMIMLLLQSSLLFSQDNKKELDNLLNLSLKELMNLTVTTAGKKEEKISDIPASVIVITKDDIRNYGYMTLEEILTNVPGLYPIRDWIDGTSFGIRGVWSLEANRNIVFLVNGMTQREECFNSNTLTTMNIPIEAIDRIEVVRGPMSVIYGSGAFFGSINIITNQMDDSDSKSIITTSFGNEKTNKIYAGIQAQNDKFKYLMNAMYYKTNGMDQPLHKLLNNFDPSIMSETTNSLLKEKRVHFDFSSSFNGFYSSMSYDESLNHMPAFVPPIINGRGSFIFETSTRVGFGYKQKLSEKTSFNSKFEYYNRVQNWSYEINEIDKYDLEGLTSSSFDAELDFFYTPNQILDITTGINYHSIGFESHFVDLPSIGFIRLHNGTKNEEPIISRAIFTQANLKLWENLQVLFGIRLEQMLRYTLKSKINVVTQNEAPIVNDYNNEKLQFVPRLALIYSPTEKHVLKMMYGKAIKMPSFLENIQWNFHPETPALESEEVQTIEFNYLSAISSSINLNISLFHNNLDNLIVRSQGLDQVGNYFTKIQNEGKLVTNGIELQIQAKIGKKFNFDIASTIQKTKDEVNTEIEVAYAPDALFYLKTSYTAKDNIILSLTGTYVSSMETQYDYTPIDAEDQASRPIGRVGRKTEPYFDLGANLRFENIFDKDIFLNLRGSNIFDTDIFYPTTGYSLWASQGTMKSGSTFLLTIGWKFNTERR